MDLTSAQAQFSASGTFLNTASLGLPPRETVDVVRATIERWSRGEHNAPDFDEPVDRSRALYAELVSTPAAEVALGSQTSQLIGHIAANLRDDAQVLVAEGEFTSGLFPFLAQQQRGMRVREVPMADLPGQINDDTTAVVSSAVQSANGALLNLDAVQDACDATGAMSVIDVTQAAGWLPIDASRFDVTVCSGYKWLLAPRGTAFLTVKPWVRAGMLVHSASWAGGADKWASIYGTPLRLASDARSLDVSPAWFCWVGQVPALELLRDVGIAQIHRHNVGLANAFLAAIGQPAGDSAIVSVAVDDSAADALQAADVQGAMRAGRLRLSFHLYNTDADAARVADVVRPYLLDQ